MATSDKLLVRNLLIFSLALGFCVGTLSYVLISSDRQIQRTNALIAHTHEVIVQSEELSALVEGMLSSERGYMLSGKVDFLKDYDSEKNNVSDHLGHLSELISDNPAQGPALDTIRSEFTELSRRIEERAKEFKAGRGSQSGVETISAMKNEILRANDAFLHEEYKTLNEHISLVEKRRSQYFYTLLIGGIAGAILLLVFNGFLFKVQMKRERAEKSLKSTEERFTLAVQGMNDGIFDWDIRTGNVFYSTRFFSMLGIDRPAQVGTINNFKELIHPEDAAKVEQHMERYLRRELSEYATTFRMRYATGNWVWINARAKAVFDEEGHPLRMVGSHSDITYMKEYQERLKAERDMAERANLAKRDFLAHMSHEIRTPLTAISGIAEIFQINQDSLNDKQRQLVRTLHNSTLTLKDLINDILDFSKIESGELELQEETFDLGELFDQVVSVGSVQARQKKLDFTVDYDALKDRNFYGDRVRIRQILINIIGNAIKFTESGSVSVKAEKELRHNIPFLRIEVADTGIGISKENIDLIFERFKQADSSVSRKYGGTGLGLPITRNLLQLMGGDITVESDAGKGSVFIISIPFKNKHDSMKIIEKGLFGRFSG